jgi:hypothetical protein
MLLLATINILIIFQPERRRGQILPTIAEVEPKMSP